MTAKQLDACDRASREFPAVELLSGQRLHVYEEDGEWHVWLNTEAADFDGLCLAVERTRALATAAAIDALTNATAALARTLAEAGL